MNPEDLHGIIATDVGDSYIKVAVYYLKGWHQDHWDDNIIIPNEISSVIPKGIRKSKLQLRFFMDLPFSSKDNLNDSAVSPVDNSLQPKSDTPIESNQMQEMYDQLLGTLRTHFNIEAPSLKKFSRFTQPIESLYIWSVYEYLCRKVSEKLAIGEKLEGWGLDAPFERRYWAIFIAVPHHDLKRDQKRTNEIHRWLLKQLGFGFYVVREQHILSAYAHFPKIQSKLPCPGFLIDVGGESIVTTALNFSNNPVSSIRFFKPAIISQTTYNGKAAGKKVEKRYMEANEAHFEELFPNLVAALERFLFEGGSIFRCHDSTTHQDSQLFSVKVGDIEHQLPERAKWVPTLIFEPENYELQDYNSLQQVMNATIQATELAAGYDIEKILKIVIISGGGAKFPSFNERLKEEIHARYAVNEVEFITTHNPQFSVIEGEKKLVEAFLPPQSFKRLFSFLKPRWV